MKKKVVNQRSVQQLEVPRRTYRKTSHRGLPLILAVAVIALASYLTALKTDTVSKNERWLEVDPERLYFGEVWADDAFKWSFSVRNVADREVYVEGFQISCACTHIEPEQFRLAPGESQNLAVTLNLMRPPSDTTAQWMRDFSVALIPKFRDRAMKRRGWSLRGRVRDPFVISAPSLQVTQPVRHGSEASSESILIRAQDGVATIEAVANAPWCEAVLTPAASDREFRLYVNVSADAPTGVQTSSVTLRAIKVDGDPLVSVKVPVSVQVVNMIQASPSDLVLGTLRIGTTAESTVVLSPTTGINFEVTRVENNDVSLVVAPVENGSHASCAFQIRKKATAPGFQQSQIVFFALQEGESQSMRIPVGVTYFGMEE